MHLLIDGLFVKQAYVKLKNITKLVIDEVDVMLDLGFRFQLTNLFELMPEKRQNTMFSATMTNDISVLIDDFFTKPEKVTIEISGTPLENIEQSSYPVPNFYTKANLLMHLLQDSDQYSKVLVFLSSKRQADRLYETMEEFMGSELSIVHSNKSQNFRLRSVKQFEEGEKRILISTDVMARGLDIENTSHVINFDLPDTYEAYVHRSGRTGRAGNEGKTIMFFTEKELLYKNEIEALMDLKIPVLDFPKAVEVSKELTPEEKHKVREISIISKQDGTAGAGTHEKKAKNQKLNLGSGSSFQNIRNHNREGIRVLINDLKRIKVKRGVCACSERIIIQK